MLGRLPLPELHESNDPVHELNDPLHELNDPLHELNDPLHESNDPLDPLPPLPPPPFLAPPVPPPLLWDSTVNITKITTTAPATNPPIRNNFSWLL